MKPTASKAVFFTQSSSFLFENSQYLELAGEYRF